VGFTLPNGLGISGQWRYFSSVKNDTLSGDADLNFLLGSHSNPGSARLNAKSFFDLALTARVADKYNFGLVPTTFSTPIRRSPVVSRRAGSAT
jgi:hypothetical protein